MILLKLIIAGYRRTPLRMLLIALACIIANAGLVAVLTLNDAARQSYSKAAPPLAMNISHKLISTDSAHLSKAFYADLRRQGFSGLIAVARQSIQLPQLPAVHQTLTLVGIDSYALPVQQGSVPDRGETLWLLSPTVLIEQQFYAQLDLPEGQALIATGIGKIPFLQPVSMSGLGHTLMTDIGIFQNLTGETGINEIWVREDTDKDSLTQAISGKARLLPLLDAADPGELTASFQLNLLAMALLMLAVCMFVVFNALHLLYCSRIEDFTIARQLGVSARQLATVQLIELALISVLCVLPGIALGIFLAKLLSPAVMATLANIYGVSANLGDISLLSLIIKCLLASLAAVLLVAAFPLHQLLRRTNLTSSTPPHQGADKYWWLLSVLCLGGAAGIHIFTDGLVSGLMLIALLLLGGCAVLILLLPKLLKSLTRMLPIRWLLPRYALASAIHVQGASRIAFCAFFIAVTANLGMNLMVDSFRQATHDWLTQRLQADLYLRVEQADDFHAWFKHTLPMVEIHPRLNATARVNSQYVEVRSYPTGQVHQNALALFLDTPDGWQQFIQGSGVMINQQLAFRHNLSVGDRLPLALDGLAPRQLNIAGVYYDYGNPRAQILLPTTSLEGIARHSGRFAVFAPMNNQSAILEHIQHSGFAVQWYDSPALIALSMETFARTFVITDSLNLVTLLVAAFSLATSVYIMASDNAPERAIVGSIGVSANQRLLISLGQYLILAFSTCLLALPLAGLLSWLLVNQINVDAFHWSYPLLISSSPIVTVVGIACLLVILFVMVPVYRQAYRPLVEDLQWLE